VDLRDTPAHYGLVTKLLHWSIALSIVFLVWLGWYMAGLSYFDKWYPRSLSLHKSLGMVVFGLAAVFLLWKRFSPSHHVAKSGPHWQHVAAAMMHRLLVLLMFIVPATGYLISTSAGKPVSVFGLFDVGALFEVRGQVREIVIAAHYYLSYTIGALALIHAIAAVKHELIDRDGTLARMIWR